MTYSGERNMSKADRQFYGWVSVIVSVIIGWKPARSLVVIWTRFLGRIPFVLKLRRAVYMLPWTYRLRLLGAAALLILGLVIIFKNRTAKEFWQTTVKSRVRRIKKRIAAMTDKDALVRIMRSAPLSEVRTAAEERRNALAMELLSPGGSLEAVREEVRNVIQTGMYDKSRTEFLAQAAKKYPEILKEYWPQLEAWAHQDSKQHSDQKPGFHTDRTDYYDYFRYPDGRTVANKSGRKRHTDSRGSYSDCHDDFHQDATTHTDNAHAEKIVRFKPWTGEAD